MKIHSVRYSVLVWLFYFCASVTSAQSSKYQGLLWEISGNGMSKPSYLYGTMHVSNKVAFHLGEPFFEALSKVDKLALEVNPDTWLADYLKSDNFSNQFSTNLYVSDFGTNDPFERNLEIKKDQKDLIKSALSDDPAIINQFMFRSDKYKADFQEDTYLDLYIYQSGRKLGKPVMGLESLPEMDWNSDMSEKAKAYEDYTLKSGKNKLYSWEGGKKIEEAYRRGDLDELDSLSALLSSDSTREYILFKRNIVMVERMTREMKDKAMFVGVGAGHLPGPRGVIELLRSKGYTVKAVDMGDRDAATRDKLEAQVVQRDFKSYTAPDGAFSVEVPDDMFCLRSRAAEQDFLAADMINGIYFTVTRIKTYAAVDRFNTDRIKRMVDSLLYENVPGKILEQKDIEKDGAKGFYVLNKTRKGDIQAYNILITPDELYIFKVSGTGENAKSEYGQRFLNSIKLQTPADNSWKPFTPKNNLFTVTMPGTPVSYLQQERVYNGSKFDLLTQDKATGNAYLLIRTSISNPDYFEEDTFELSLMAFDFGKKNNYKEQNRTWSDIGGRKALRVQYSTTDSQSIAAAFVLQNLHYYALAAFYKNDSSKNEQFLTSLKFSNPTYKNFTTYTDSILHFTVKLPYKQVPSNSLQTWSYGTLNDNKVKALSKTEVFSPPGTYEPFEVSYYQFSPYYQDDDTAAYLNRRRKKQTYNFDYIIKSEKVSNKNGLLTIDYVYADTNSTRQIHERTVLKNGVRYMLTAYVDTVLGESEYVKTFFETFKPLDTVIGTPLFADHTPRFLKDVLSTDSVTRTRAMDQADEASFNNKSLPALMAAVDGIPSSKVYADIKSMLLRKFANVKSPTALPFLEKQYYAAGDTSQYQFAILKALGDMKRADATAMFKKLITNEPPLSDDMDDVYELFYPYYDTLQLTKLLYPDMLDLVIIPEYKHEVYTMLGELIDSGLIKSNVYRDKKRLILSEAKLELRRENGSKKSEYDNDGNYKLYNFNTLLVPFIKEADVHNYFERMLKVQDPYIRMMTAIRLEKNKVPVADSIWYNLAKDDDYRVRLYALLEKNHLLNKYPAEFRSQQKFNEAILRRNINSGTNTVDTFTVLLNVPSEFRGNTGRVYLYKYKVTKDKDWKLAMLGLQPEDENKVDGKYEIYDLKSEYLDTKKTPADQLRDMIYKARKKNKRSSSY